MEGEPARGFERLLRRLDSATRARHCGAALEDKLRGVLAQFRQCAQAMDHARQVDEATKSLIANAASGPRVRVGSAAIAQQLAELGELETAMQVALVALVAGAKDRFPAEVAVSSVAPRPPPDVDVKVEQLAPQPLSEELLSSLEKMRSLLVQQHGDSWLRDALDAARAAVRALDTVEDSDKRKEFSLDDQRVFDVFKLLRKTVLKNVSTYPDECASFRKVLKRLLKKRPVFSIFVERSEELLAGKLAKAAMKPKEDLKKTKEEAKAATSSALKPAEIESTKKSKKRKLSEPSEGKISPSPPKAAPSAVASACANIRSKAQLCSVKAQALGEVFSLSAFDVCLKLMIDVVNALTPQFTGDDTASVSATLFLLVDAADKIKVLDKRRDRLVCLESLLSVLLTKDRVPWDSTRTKKTAQDRLTQCRESIEALRRPEFSAASSAKEMAVVPTKKKQKKKDKPAPSHKRFDED